MIFVATNQYANKVEYYGVVKLDLSNDTVAANTLVSGITAHGANGAPITGELVIQRYYTGSSEPSASLGNDGDIYFQR